MIEDAYDAGVDDPVADLLTVALVGDYSPVSQPPEMIRHGRCLTAQRFCQLGHTASRFSDQRMKQPESIDVGQVLEDTF